MKDFLEIFTVNSIDWEVKNCDLDLILSKRTSTSKDRIYLRVLNSEVSSENIAHLSEYLV